ncbi:DUF6042 family protein [Umezawaea sp. Da 62-37]|uniref:DUF6042 family protein n=1 Tax=Umezawaea sp. Da 62-37 TaxID=3075927 RepID=UPI0028F71603|nr:DUF6042 family protein [Umezawaea sp. Da 62-37]WNV84719.1 DUF6042 family protein [Umezawaea sp. Da 62-37]
MIASSPPNTSPSSWLQVLTTVDAHGWSRLLPPSGLLHAMAKATTRGITGDLETVLGHDALSSGPDDRISWLDDEEYDDIPADVQSEQNELDRQNQNFFETVMADSGRAIPVTTRQLADLLVDLGVLVHDMGVGVEVWRIATTVPRPSDVLTLAAEWTRKQELQAAAPVASTLIGLFEDRQKTEMNTTIDRLAEDCREDGDNVRPGLMSLTSSGDVTVLRRGKDTSVGEVDLSVVPSHARMTILVNWDHINATHLSFALTRPAE